MASDILGLFTTPEQYKLAQRQAQEAEAVRYAQLDPRAQAQYGFYRAGQQLGGAIGGALGGQDPQLQKISQRQQILGMIDPNNPDSYAQAIQAALQTGDQEAAFLLRNEMMKAKEQAQQQEIRGFEREKFLLDRGTGIRDRGMAANALELSKGLIKADGTVDETVYNELLGYGQIGSTIIDQRLKATQGLKTVQVQNIAKGLFNADGTPNLQIIAELRKTPEGRKILEENAPKTMSVKGDETIMTVPVLGEDSKVIKQGETPRKTITIGNRVIDANTLAVLYTAPDATPTALAEWKAFSALPKNEQQSFLKLQASKRPSTTINMPNEGERKAATLANRLNFSVDQINQAIGIDPSAAMPTTSVEIARFLSRTEFIPNKLTSAQRQIVESAQLDILDAALTLGTGAAYTREQLEGYRKSYFPQINDKPENVAAKRARLQNILKSAEIASGRAKVPTPIPSLGGDLSSIINAPPSN